MTEAEWLTTKMPLYMLREYPLKWDERKAFLAACHCLRHSWFLLSDLQRQYCEAVERFGEGNESTEEVDRLFFEVQAERQRDPRGAVGFHVHSAIQSFSHCPSQDSLIYVFRYIALSVASSAEADEKEWQHRLLREVFGNPFRPVRADPSWLTSDVLLLARGIYDEKAFDRMPILADALQDAGCDNADVLDHCRQPGEHVRGCWVIDMLLGMG